MKVEVSNLTKMYGDFCAVREVSFDFQSGRVSALIGRNGSGKTSTIRMMLGTLAKSSGKVLADGKPLDQQLNNIGYLSEERGIYVKDSIISQLVYFASLKGMSRKNAKIAAEKWLDKLGILDRKNDKVETLSKGNQQKIQIIASLLHDPDIVIFDEPFSGLDPVNAKFLVDLLMQLRNENKCILISSHQLHLLEDVCDDVAIISYSNLIYKGSLNKLKEEKGGKRLIIKFVNASKKDIEEIGYLEAGDNEKYYVDLNIDRTCKDVINDLFIRNLEIETFEVKEKTLNDIFIEMEGV